jgi:hypothetical protein
MVQAKLIVATQTGFACCCWLSSPRLVSITVARASIQKVFFLEKKHHGIQDQQETLTLHPSVLTHFLRRFFDVEETSKKRRRIVHFWRVRPISDEISADHLVLVVNAREYKTHETTTVQAPPKHAREEESSFRSLPPPPPPLQ